MDGWQHMVENEWNMMDDRSHLCTYGIHPNGNLPIIDNSEPCWSMHVKVNDDMYKAMHNTEPSNSATYQCVRNSSSISWNSDDVVGDGTDECYDGDDDGGDDEGDGDGDGDDESYDDNCAGYGDGNHLL